MAAPPHRRAAGHGQDQTRRAGRRGLDSPVLLGGEIVRDADHAPPQSSGSSTDHDHRTPILRRRPHLRRHGQEVRHRVLAQADNVARVYLYGKQVDQPTTREQKEVIEGIVATDYDGRTLIELLQNGHDAHPADRADGQLEFLPRENEDSWGVLYIANGGHPVSDADFTSMCNVVMSSKRPDEGIGNKGVGFKSVLQLADSPEIYSMQRAGSGVFDGYCFRFAQPGDFNDVAARVDPQQPGLADELRDNVASLKVPVPLEAIPPVVAGYAERGFATVVRLVLRSAEARERACQQLDALAPIDAPLHLFLERLATIVLARTGMGDEVRSASMRGAAQWSTP